MIDFNEKGSHMKHELTMAEIAKFQQEYEKLANNELFARAAKLTTLDKA